MGSLPQPPCGRVIRGALSVGETDFLLRRSGGGNLTHPKLKIQHPKSPQPEAEGVAGWFVVWGGGGGGEPCSG